MWSLLCAVHGAVVDVDFRRTVVDKRGKAMVIDVVKHVDVAKHVHDTFGRIVEHMVNAGLQQDADKVEQLGRDYVLMLSTLSHRELWEMVNNRRESGQLRDLRLCFRLVEETVVERLIDEADLAAEPSPSPKRQPSW
jgi:hypothetical protein